MVSMKRNLIACRTFESMSSKANESVKRTNLSSMESIRQLAQLENFLPDLFVLGIFFDIVDTQRIEPFRPDRIDGLYLRMSGRPAPFGVDLLPFFTGGPTGEKQSGIRMGASLKIAVALIDPIPSLNRKFTGAPFFMRPGN